MAYTAGTKQPVQHAGAVTADAIRAHAARHACLPLHLFGSWDSSNQAWPFGECFASRMQDIGNVCVLECGALPLASQHDMSW